MAARCSQATISRVERGHLDLISMRVLRRLLAAVDATASIDVRWRGAAIERLIDDGHAHLVAGVAAHLRTRGWLVEVEVSYSEFGERGSYDLLAFHPGSGALLAIEVKTDLPSAEATLRKLDEKTRLARKIARERFGWNASSVSRLLVMLATRTNRRRIGRHAALFDQVLPVSTVGVRRWLKSPVGSMAGIWFVSSSHGQTVIPSKPAPERVRRLKS